MWHIIWIAIFCILQENRCTRQSAVIKTGPTTIVCFLNRTTDYRSIKIIHERELYHRNVSTIKNGSVTQDISHIQVNVEDKNVISITFLTALCNDGGDYILIVFGQYGVIAEVRGTFLTLGK